MGKHARDFYYDCMTKFGGELPGSFAANNPVGERSCRKKAKTCLDFFKVIQTDEEKETMLPTVVSASQALSPDAAAQLEGKRRFIAQHLTELLASKLLHKYLLQAEKQGGSTLPPSLKGMKNPKTTAAAMMMVTTIESKLTGANKKMWEHLKTPDRQEFQRWRSDPSTWKIALPW